MSVWFIENETKYVDYTNHSLVGIYFGFYFSAKLSSVVVYDKKYD